MVTRTLTLTEFLLARIAQDEAWANYTEGPWLDRYGDGLDRMSPARVLPEEYEAKRRIVDLHSGDDDPSDCPPWGRKHGEPCATLRALALPYADHPDYREEWKP